MGTFLLDGEGKYPTGVNPGSLMSQFLLVLMKIIIINKLPYYMKFSRHVYFVILRCAYFATRKFRDFAKILYYESL